MAARSRLLLVVLGIGLSLPTTPRTADADEPGPQSADPVQRRLERLEAEVWFLRSERAVRPAGHSVDTPSPTWSGYEVVPEPDDSGGIPTSTVHCDEIGCTDRLFGNASDYPSVRLTGFFQADAVWFRQDAANRAAVGDVQDGVDFRRARLAATGDAYENVGYMLEMDFAFPGRPTFMDVWMEIREVPVLGNVRIGQWRHPAGMDPLTSVKELTFIERGLPFALVPFRQIGIGFHDVAEDESATWAVSGFRYPTDPFGAGVGDDGGYGLAARLTWLPVDAGDDGVVHVGGSYSFADPANNLLRVASAPEFFDSSTIALPGVPSTVPPFVNTGFLPTHDYNLFGAELAATSGPFHAQSEIMFLVVDRIGAGSATFPSAYAQVAWILTGESRPYNRKAGVMGRIVPDRPVGKCGGPGAWEVAFRWSWIDLDDGTVRGNRLTDLTAGLNWYLNANTKFQLNYVHAMLAANGTGNGEADIVGVRGQVDF